MTDYLTKSLFQTEPTEQLPCPGSVQIAFSNALDNEYDYLVTQDLWPLQAGQRVIAPFGRSNKPNEGFVIEVNPGKDKEKKFKLKKISQVIDPAPLLDDQLMALAKWISQYYVCPLGQVLAAMVPAAVKNAAGEKKEKLIWLNQTDPQILENLKGKKQKLIIESLKASQALDEDSAIPAQQLLSIADCTNHVLKKLAEKMIIAVTYRTVLKSLPPVPASLARPENNQITLNSHQQKALNDITAQNDSEKFAVTLLHGVTDSGKTEVYIRAIQAALEKGKSAIVLLPEIALTAQTLQRFSRRFEKIAMMHSALTAAQRNEQWQKIKAGNADVVIGARSAIFAPLKNLGIIVVDEEHEPSFKQDVTPRYNARDVAIKRAQLCDGVCLLGSATPSLETLANCQTKKHFHLASLPARVMDLPSPAITLVDLKENFLTSKGLQLISPTLTEKINQTLDKNQQAILLLNRRGYSRFIFCPACKHTLRCQNCDVSLTFHKSKPRNENANPLPGRHLNHGTAICHYCSAKTLVPQKCPVCSASMKMVGFGSQRLREELASKFPSANIARIDSDSMAGKDYYNLLENFGKGKIDILAGTQMLAKGLHFPNVTLVGIISADTALYIPDFRANERTFQLICQVAGRTGRSEKGGQVLLQTFLKDQPAIQFALKGDFAGFVKEELKHRKTCNLPPYWRLAAITLQDKNYEKLTAAANAVRRKIDAIIAAANLTADVRGPVPAGINRIQRFHRIRILIKTPDAKTMIHLFNSLRNADLPKSVIRTAIDVDPVNLI